MKRKVFAYPYIVWMVLFIAVPMLFIFYYAFNVDGSFSFSKFWATLSDPEKWRVLWVSIEIAFGTTVFCLLLGYPVAYILSNMRRSVAGFISVLFFVPMWMNFVLRTYAWQAILEYAIPNLLGWADKTLTGSVGSVMMVLVYNFIPFMVMPLYNSLSKIDKSLIEASGDLGANKRMTFFKVVLRLHPSPAAVGFIYKNQSGNRPKGDYMNTVDEVERITSLDFFSALPDSIEERVEVQLGDFGI